MDNVVYVIVGVAAVLGALSGIYRLRYRQRVEAKLDRIIDLLERGPS
jgi:hypothetical protein